jgi:membrane-associated protease RseP (regulator of RpoE activity)
VTEARKTDAERLREAQGGAFDREALIQAGVRPDEVEGLRELWEQSEMDKLYLSDAAARDGWLPSRRYREELRTLNEEFRQELGDDSYDQLLFATGRPNRVIVQDVLEDSPADYAGLQAGDAIVSYDEMRVFRPGELKLATSGGRRGELVPVSVIRGDQRMIVYVERGPLGVIIQTERRSPVADG